MKKMQDSDDTKRIISPDNPSSNNHSIHQRSVIQNVDSRNEIGGLKSASDKNPSLVAAKISIYDKKSHQQEEGNESKKSNSNVVKTIEVPNTSKLYDVDLENGIRNVKDKEAIIERKKQTTVDDCADNNEKEKKNKPSIFKSVRFYVMLITLISPIVSMYSKNIINFTIIRMIDPEYIRREVRQPANLSTPYFDLDNSCPVDDDLVRARLLKELELATNKARDTVGEKFQWDEIQQGWLKAAFSIGHIPLQIAGSRLSEIYNPHIVLTGSILVSAICSLLAPFMASIHYFLLFTDLLLMGIVGSFVTPTLITLFSNWLTPGEKSIMLTCYLISSRLGSAITSFICGDVFKADISWRYIFYSAAGANFIFVVLFYIFATSRPIEHSFISDLELDYLATKNILVRESLEEDKKQTIDTTELKTISINGNGEHKQATNNNNNNSISLSMKKKTAVDKKKTNPPWKAILTSVPVWSFIVTKFCVKLSGDLVSIELPAYLDRVMHYEADLNGDINGYSYIFFCLGSFVAGALAKVAVKRQPFGLSKTTIRKIFQSFASFGVAALIMSLTFSMCDSTPTNTFLFLWFFVTTFGTGGEQQIPMDITERYPGTIHAIASTLAISGVIVPNVVGAYLQGHAADRDKWKIIWLTASAISAIGGFVFLLGADARIQPFDSVTVSSESSESDNSISNDKKKRMEAKHKTSTEEGNDNKAYEKDDGIQVVVTVDNNNKESKQI